MKLDKAHIALIDDNEDILFSGRALLESKVESIRCYPHPEKLLEHNNSDELSLIFLDLNYSNNEVSGEEGLHYLRKIKDRYPQVEVVVMTAFAEIELAVEAVKQGAFDFITKPWTAERLYIALEKAHRSHLQKQELQQKSLHIQSLNEQIQPLLGESEAIRKVRSAIPALCEVQLLVISGEPGSGKRLLAQHIHKHSNRSDFPFIINELSALPAGPGTHYVKFDEQLDFKALQAQLNAGHFIILGVNSLNALDLKSKLGGLIYQQISIPPLREIWEDAAEIVQYYLEQFNQKHHQNLSFKTEQLDPLAKLPWVENYRELIQAIEKSVLQSEGPYLKLEGSFSETPRRKKLWEMERDQIAQVLAWNQGNISKSAKELGITRASLYRRIEKFKLDYETD